jgi:hypothetical protein
MQETFFRILDVSANTVAHGLLELYDLPHVARQHINSYSQDGGKE